MAKPAGLHSDEHFAGARFGDRDGGYGNGPARRGEDGGGGMRRSHATATSATGSPAAFQASKPPVTFTTWRNPARRNRLAAMALR
jgi:hypothetical protein